jgi:hypothetical protein
VRGLTFQVDQVFRPGEGRSDVVFFVETKANGWAVGSVEWAADSSDDRPVTADGASQVASDPAVAAAGAAGDAGSSADDRLATGVGATAAVVAAASWTLGDAAAVGAAVAVVAVAVAAVAGTAGSAAGAGVADAAAAVRSPELGAIGWLVPVVSRCSRRLKRPILRQRRKRPLTGARPPLRPLGCGGPRRRLRGSGPRPHRRPCPGPWTR